MSFRRPRPTSNPYLSLLWAGLCDADGVDPHFFSWSAALWGRWDVLHVQWPETLLSGRTRWRRRVNELRYALLLARVRLTRRGLVRTAHNVTAHTPTSRIGGLLARLTERWADQAIRLNDATPIRPGVGVRTVPHGHYRDWYQLPEQITPHPTRLLFFGLIRPYKGLEELLAAVLGAPEATMELRIVGAPADPELAARVHAAAATDARISCDLRHLADTELSAEIGAAAVVVLPYRELHNSGALLLALSLDRPVLVPDGKVTQALAEEVGAQWVQRYPSSTGSVQVESLEAALVAAADLTGRPDLAARDWSGTAAAHRAVYRLAAEAGSRKQDQSDRQHQVI